MLRTISTFAKYGGVNVEGLSSLHTGENGVYFGLRSPLASPKFGNPAIDKSLSLEVGNAILVKVVEPFQENPQVSVITLDLEGQGIRSMEYDPSVGLYFIISGSTYSDSGSFSLWSWDPISNSLQKIKVPSLEKLCRPESVIPMDFPTGHGLLLLSENSGRACVDSKVQFIKLKIN